jgi:NAD(P)H-hydrate epimerase
MGLTGAAALCSEAALTAGAGLVTLGIPVSLNPPMEAKLTEVMTLPLPDTATGCLNANAAEKLLEFAERCDVLAIGPGLGRDPSTGKLVRAVLRGFQGPALLDADGIFALQPHPDILKGKPIVMTPHPGEMAHFLGQPLERVMAAPWETARETARRLDITVVLKGARTVIASPEGKLRINSTGNPAMASAGMGDVLSGLIAAFLAQGLPPFEAALAGVYLHGLSADLLVSETGWHVVTAGEVMNRSREAFRVIVTANAAHRLSASQHRSFESSKEG